MNTESTKNNHAEDLIQFIWNKRKLIILLTMIGAIASIAYSFMVKEKYKSAVTLYPASSSTVSFTDDITPEQSASQFGEEEQAEQMIQVLQSAEIRNHIISKFQLMKHYDIDTSSNIKITKLNKTYQENVSFSRTRYGSVVIEVLDENPKMAADIANEIAFYFDNAKNRMIHERSQEAFEVAKKERDQLKKEISIIVDTMAALNRIGVVDGETRSTLITALVDAKDAKTRKLIEQKIEATDKYGSVYSSFEFKLEWMNIRLSTKDAVYEQLKADATSFFSHKFTVEKAYPAEKKAYPIRWLIVVVSTISVFLFSIVILLVLEKIKELKRREA